MAATPEHGGDGVPLLIFVNVTLIDAVLDWPSQKADFERDGSLRDIYVQDATIDDWKLVVARILDGNYRARLDVPLPNDFDAVFGGAGRPHMSFTVGDVMLDCHFFMASEIEFSFTPKDVSEMSLRDLLTFMIGIGDAIGKPVIMTPENDPQSPIFSYDSNEHQLRWISPHSN